MSAVEAIEARIGQGRTPTLGEIGGVDAILRDREAVAVCPVFDVFVECLCEASGEEQSALRDVLLDGIARQPTPLVFREAMSALIAAPCLLRAIKPSVFKTLQARIDDRVTPSNALLAAYTLEGLFRVGLDDDAAKWTTLIVLNEVQSNDHGVFATHTAKIAGVAYQHWREPSLRSLLGRLQGSVEAEDDAAFELGIIAFVGALEADGSDGVRTGLREAQVLFDEVLRRDAGRLDASIQSTMINILLGFVDGGSDGLASRIENLGRLLAERHDGLGIRGLPNWLIPRSMRDVEWWRLMRLLDRVASDLGRPSWLNAARVLERVLAVYEGELSLSERPGVGMIVAPRIEAAFVRERGLLAHLDDVLDREEWETDRRPIAERLRTRITERIAEGAPSRLEAEGGAYPRLSAILQNDEVSRLPEAMADRLERSLVDKAAIEGAAYQNDVQRICARVAANFERATDYQGIVRPAFNDLVQQVVGFCKSRQNETAAQAGARCAYLRDANALEADLQADLKDFLAGNMPGFEILTEVQGVAAGRSDIYVATGGFRFIVELKRHFGAVDDDVVRQYRGQASAYQASGPKLGMMGILELLDRPGPPPSVDECVWPHVYVPEGSHQPRHLVVFRVPRILKTPSLMSKAKEMSK